MKSAKYCLNRKFWNRNNYQSVENEKTVHNGVIKEDLEPCGVFMFMGDDVGIPYVPTHTVYDWEGYQRYGGQ